MLKGWHGGGGGIQDSLYVRIISWASFVERSASPAVWYSRRERSDRKQDGDEKGRERGWFNFILVTRSSQSRSFASSEEKV